jgi:hypothetical protein
MKPATVKAVKKGSAAQPTAGAVTLIEQAPDALAEVLSISQMYTFMDCPARWAFKYMHGDPDPANANLGLGSAVHEAIGYNMAQKVHTETDLDLAEVQEVFRMAWAEKQAEMVLADDEDPVQLGAEGERLVALYMEQVAPKVQPAAVELHVTGTLGGVKVQGHVDLLEADGTIRDLKTAKTAPSKISGHNMLQLSTYEQLCPGASGKVVVDTLVRNKTPKLVQLEHTITDQDRLAPERIYPMAQATMRNGYFMPNRTSNLCSRRNCAHWRACEDAYGGRVEDK